MNYILFDSDVRSSLLPFTYTRPVADIRIGILTIREKWEKFLGFTTTSITEEYLEAKYPMVELEENVLLRIVKFIFYALNSVSGILVYFLIMFMIAYLYFNLHESKYNIFLKNRIAKLGARDEEQL